MEKEQKMKNFMFEEHEASVSRAARSNSVADAMLRRSDQDKLEKTIFLLIDTNGSTDIESIHSVWDSASKGDRSRRIIGGVINKLKIKEYIDVEEKEGSDPVYTRGRRFRDWEEVIPENIRDVSQSKHCHEGGKEEGT